MVRAAHTVLTRLDPRHLLAPPGPFRATAWRSPLRGPWFTAVLSTVLLVGLPVVFLTGLLSYAAYDPRLGSGNDRTPGKGLLGGYLFDWPAHPPWLYRAVIGVHVLVGLALVPVVLAKLWSVIPRLFTWPPVRSPIHALERLSLALLVGGAVFEMGTGLLNTQLFYPWPFSFYTAHFYGAWVFVGALLSHVALKLPAWRTGLRSRRLRTELATDLAGTEAEADDGSGLAPANPASPTISRRAALGVVGGGSLLLVGLAAGQTVGDRWRGTALLAPRGGDPGHDFPVNKTAAARGIDPRDTGDAWRLELVGPARTLTLSREELLGLPQHTARLPIACVEGWSTVQTWTGVRLRDLAAMVEDGAAPAMLVESLQRGGAFGHAVLAANQVRAGDSMLALRVNGRDLSLDHGFPARVVVPAAPGVHATKWVRRLSTLGASS